MCDTFRVHLKPAGAIAAAGAYPVYWQFPDVAGTVTFLPQGGNYNYWLNNNAGAAAVPQTILLNLPQP